MDSLTQLVLGATVAAAAVPVNQRRRALLYGAALGTLPDLDILVRYADPVANMTWHRSYSHSLLLLPPLAVLLWWLALRLDTQLRQAPRRWLLAFALALITHPLLDAFTVYGTQLWWPLDPTPIGLGSIFIIDPLYTLPLLLAVLWLARPASAAKPVRGGRVLASALGCSSAYLLWSVLAQQYVLNRALSDPQRPAHAEARLMATPAPFSTLLWRVIQRQPGGYDEAYMALLADSAPTPWRSYLSRDDLGESLRGHPPFERLRWFNHGWYGLQLEQQQLVLSDLRMGSEPIYVFAFALADGPENALKPIPAEQLQRDRPNGQMLQWLTQRALNPGDCLETAEQMIASAMPPQIEQRCLRSD